jgi:hypothetical protein
MIDLMTDRVILSKPAFTVAFDLKSVALTRREVVQMDDGSVWTVAYRRPEYWDHNPSTPLVVGHRFGHRDFVGALEFIRSAEGDFITAEHPMVTR